MTYEDYEKDIKTLERDRDFIGNGQHREQETITSSTNEFLQKLIASITDPQHRRLLQAYANVNPASSKASMEHELARILLEVVDRAN